MPEFDYFVLFAEMRTGSNFLEANLNAFDGIHCHGEAFNPNFIGYPNRSEILGITQEERDASPQSLIAAIRAQSAGRDSVIEGFRYFNDHDGRVLEPILTDPRCAKIVLTRNPLESYISRKIAAATGQWKLTHAKHAKSQKITFVAAEFAAHVDRLQNFQVHILNTLQKTGQTAFYVDYEDVRHVEVMNGIAAWLGRKARLDALDRNLKKQNPEPIQAKVNNVAEMEAALARFDRFNLSRTPNFEPRRGPLVPTYIAAPESGLLFLPMRSGPEDVVTDWLSALDGGGKVRLKFNQKSLRAWKLEQRPNRSFTVIRHPVARVHAAFCDRILPAAGPGVFTDIRRNLRQHFNLPLPEGAVGQEYSAEEHREAFKAFLRFVKSSLNGQTNLRVDPAWATQSTLLQGFASYQTPDHVIREPDMAEELPRLARRVGAEAPPGLPEETDRHAPALERVYDAEIEAMARDAYLRDYEAFGFDDWPA